MEKKEETNHPVFIRFFRRQLLCVCALLLLCAVTVAVFDPFYHYHAPLFGMRAVLTEKEYQVDGTLKNFSYDAILLGSSHSENFDLAQAEDLFGLPFVKAVRSGGNLFDLCTYADTAFASRDLSLVLFNLDAAVLHNPEEGTFATDGYPLYLSDRNPFNDVRYLWNKDVLLRRIPYALAQSADASYEAARPYSWYANKEFSEEATLSHYPRHPVIEDMKDPRAEEASLTRNCDRLLALVAAHPETEFIFFFPPVSMLYWDSLYRAGTLEQVLYGEEYVMTRLLAHDNVSAYYFCDDRALITDLNRYMDFTHYDEKVNDRMMEELADPASAVRLSSPQDASRRISAMRKLVDELLATEIKALEGPGRFTYSDR